MDRKLFEVVQQRMPTFNPDVVNGFAVRHIKEVRAYLDRIIRTVEPDFPPELKYVRCERCSPTEVMSVITRNQNPRKTQELARSDVFMVKFLFTYEGNQMEPIYVYLPFVRPGGLITLQGAQFMISPVLADLSLSVTTNEIFIPMNRDRVRFWRLPKMFLKNNQPINSDVIYSPLHHNDVRGKGGVTGKTTLAHYMFAKFGVKQTFAAFANTDVIIGEAGAITPEDYPEDKWVICASGKLPTPKYTPPTVRLAIPLSQYNDTVESLVAGFFYVADLFPSRCLAEYFGDEGETRLWMVLLGHLIWGTGVSEGKLFEDVLVHQDSLDGYVDSEIRATLNMDGIYVQDIYGLFMHIIETFSIRVARSSSLVSSMYDKRLMILRYVCYDIVHWINRWMFKMKSSKKKPLSQDEIQKMAQKFIKTTQIFSLTQGHREVTPVSSPGDNKYWKITSHIVLQADSAAGNRGGKRKGSTSDPSKFLNASIAEVGSYSTMSKSEPTGRNKINPFVHTTEEGLIKRNPEVYEIIDKTQAAIQR